MSEKRAYDMMGVIQWRRPALPADSPPGPVSASGAPPGATVEIPLEGPSGLNHPRIQAIMFALFSILLGIGFAVACVVLSLMLWTSPGKSPFVLGGIIAVGGCVLAVVLYRPEDARPRMEVGSGTVKIRLPGYRRPLIVSRDNVRVVSVDPTPLQMWHNNKRFPIAEPLPPEVFADALERTIGDPWNPGEPHSPVPRDPAVAQRLPDRWQPPIDEIVPGTKQGDALPPWLAKLAAENANAASQPAGAGAPREPEEHESGWAAVGSVKAPEPPKMRGFLYSGDGSALPVFRANAEHIPNVAMIFHHAIVLPGNGLRRNPLAPTLLGSKPLRAVGIMVRAAHPEQADTAFRRWGVVRPITADDVLPQGIRPPKPLKGIRAVVYAAALFVPLILKIIFHHPHGWLGR